MQTWEQEGSALREGSYADGGEKTQREKKSGNQFVVVDETVRVDGVAVPSSCGGRRAQTRLKAAWWWAGGTEVREASQA